MAVIPNVITHGLMALDVYNELDVSTVQKAIKKHPRAYLLGSNGPDILFYYKVFPWQDQELNKIVADYGGIVHRTHVNDFYNQAVSFIKEMKDERRKTILIAFIAGHFQHWSLDSLAHPFVFYRGGEIAGATRYWHFRYESMLDSLMVTYVKGRDMASLKPKRFVDVDEEERRVIASFYQAMLVQVFGIYLEPLVIEEAICSFKKILNYLYDPHNIMTPVIQKLERKMAYPWAFSSHIVNSNIDARYDVLNLKRDTWSNPTNIDETSNETFMELYESSIVLGNECIGALNDALEHNEPVNFDALLGNRRYDTGRPPGREMKYYDSIYQK
ncbi:zinc dependent phospholipase C family protein [Erysipelothrix rhusiopathiae]|uniref:zinc dependent phospholipase C family protein n=1 Tax=Erysipelothrix rhusiopathiae TaxID=1648 RepID=UPI001EE08CEB|nr:zinc dependent phospholipase C family protein [Erysipelothrix rhusiopathiae]MDE8143039.1 zinc dependent phospholipase C family protein [Erysipelothrix rhusiopathiae]MDE8163033.1 zinc dependent phospholipase C family protein [Erysipelothrix rhusiopathiae]MDE8166148.1 zinc dependent phospholipase C family protein [Erysipelothrix rhusiopathiae]MDE8209296.1 zinc dependent phospholipase C family protein [Erysipelothrix rhusiopathiae]